jgi:hypothetical protein
MKPSSRNLLLGATLFGAGASAILGACSATGAPRTFASTGAGGAGGQGGMPDLNLGGGSDQGGGPGVTVDPTTCEEATKKRSYVGCDFWPTPLDNIVDAVFDYAVVAANVGDQPADVTVTRGGVTVATAHIAPNALATMALPWVEGLRQVPPDSCGAFGALTATARVDGGAYHVVSTRPVAVYQFNPLEYQSVGGPPGKDWAACFSCPGGDCNSYKMTLPCCSRARRSPGITGSPGKRATGTPPRRTSPSPGPRPTPRSPSSSLRGRRSDRKSVV